ncbi:MAG: hypothetical protein ACLQVD_10130 [Capsulimonadaceae bacterium]
MVAQVIEGTWEEIKSHEAELVGRLLRVTIMPQSPNSPTALQAPGLSALDPVGRSPASSERDSRRDDELSDRAWSIYAELKRKLEPDLNGSYIAIHPKSADHEIAQRAPWARRELRKRHADGDIVVITIGPVFADNPLSWRNREDAYWTSRALKSLESGRASDEEVVAVMNRRQAAE